MFHVGSARTALFNWAFAQQRGGDFVLRIEDTDASRNRPEWTEGIIAALDWLGIRRGEYEGPFFQSANEERHAEAARRLLDGGLAYYCSCTREQVLARTGDPHRGYDGFCRDRGLAAAPGRALRFRVPDEDATIGDFPIARGDGSVLFLLANVVDDIQMRISHVIRGEEHLPNAPKQQLMWTALGHLPPAWAHVPVIVNDKRQKLSKRRDKVALEDYRAEGYLAEAMRNYLMLLGWAPPGDREILPWPAMIAEFRLDQVISSPAFFDVRKLRAINGVYIRELPAAEFIARSQPWLAPPAAPWRPDAFRPEAFAQVAHLAQTRIGVMSEVTALVDFLFLDEPATDPQAWSRAAAMPGAREVLDAVARELATAEWEPAAIRAVVERAGDRLGLKLSQAQAQVRVAVTGRSAGLPLFESIWVLGRERTVERLRAALAAL